MVAVAVLVREFAGSGAELHALPMPTEGDRAELWMMRPTGPVLVMGSSQETAQFDSERLVRDRVGLAERRSGGGAVFIEPAATVWIDVLAPRSNKLWSSELGETFVITGRLWQQAFASLGVDTTLCLDSPRRTAISALACWAGTGWGELMIGEAKVVGLSQRRTRWGARVQAMAVLDASSARVGDYFAVEQDREQLAEAIAIEHVERLRVAGVSIERLEAAVLAAFAGFETL